MARWFGGLETDEKFRTISVLGFGLVFAVPSLWAYMATGSVNEAVLVTSRVSPPEMFAASVPSMGFLGVAVIYGTGLAAVVLASVMFRIKQYSALGRRRRNLLVAIACAISVVALLVLVWMYQQRILITSPWLAGLPAGLLLGETVVMMAVSVADKAHRSGRATRRAEVSEGLALASILGLLWAIAIGLSPLPVVSVLDADGKWHAGELIEIAPEGVWLIERHVGDSAGSVVLIDDDVNEVVVYSDESEQG